MPDGNRRALLLGSLAAVGVLAVLFFLVGAGEVLDILSAADPRFVAATVAFALCWLVAWGLMLRTVLGSLDVSVPVHTSVLVYVGAVFANNVTPFGQAGGEPVAALLISKVSDCRYETGLAGIASVDVLNVVPSLSLVFVGVGYYATTAAVGDRLGTAVASAVALVGGVVLAIAVVWRYRETLTARLPALVSPWIGRLGRGRYDAAALETDLTGRLTRFFDDIERVGTDRWRLSVVVALSLLGWLAQAVALTAAFAAVGHAIPPHVVLFAIPLANLAGATPMPGGLGGIEAAYVALLVPITGIDASAITAAVLVFRGGTYWTPVVLGGIVTSTLGVHTLR
ncbi:lysylphosphatidylglycerol synthase transmembrane domain-containing protein [Halorubrum halodurans]|uniref:TIGR00374 family protein n=1 Tax=Halorubrum halodurans TaxID=1383851 RepID=A0A256IIC2_9EURY|nr:lysylphosphatidylglycerol synthase transmembrane domain-containing protein [Halorubrum halodurans]OYR56318.1 TIGR00374 family protein [Halorubrum halodurans]